jgi:hypothetical protein
MKHPYEQPDLKKVGNFKTLTRQTIKSSAGYDGFLLKQNDGSTVPIGNVS